MNIILPKIGFLLTADFADDISLYAHLATPFDVSLEFDNAPAYLNALSALAPAQRPNLVFAEAGLLENSPVHWYQLLKFDKDHESTLMIMPSLSETLIVRWQRSFMAQGLSVDRLPGELFRHVNFCESNGISYIQDYLTIPYRKDSARMVWDFLSDPERLFTSYLCRSLSKKEICKALDLSEDRYEIYKEKIALEFDLVTRMELAASLSAAGVQDIVEFTGNINPEISTDLLTDPLGSETSKMIVDLLRAMRPEPYSPIFGEKIPAAQTIAERLQADDLASERQLLQLGKRLGIMNEGIVINPSSNIQ